MFTYLWENLFWICLRNGLCIALNRLLLWNAYNYQFILLCGGWFWCGGKGIFKTKKSHLNQPLTKPNKKPTPHAIVVARPFKNRTIQILIFISPVFKCFRILKRQFSDYYCICQFFVSGSSPLSRPTFRANQEKFGDNLVNF